MSLSIIRFGTNPPKSMHMAPTVVVSSGGDLSKKHQKSDSRLQPLTQDTFELSQSVNLSKETKTASVTPNSF